MSNLYNKFQKQWLEAYSGYTGDKNTNLKNLQDFWKNNKIYPEKITQKIQDCEKIIEDRKIKRNLKRPCTSVEEGSVKFSKAPVSKEEETVSVRVTPQCSYSSTNIVDSDICEAPLIVEEGSVKFSKAPVSKEEETVVDSDISESPLTSDNVSVNIDTSDNVSVNIPILEVVPSSSCSTHVHTPTGKHSHKSSKPLGRGKSFETFRKLINDELELSDSEPDSEDEDAIEECESNTEKILEETTNVQLEEETTNVQLEEETTNVQLEETEKILEETTYVQLEREETTNVQLEEEMSVQGVEVQSIEKDVSTSNTGSNLVKKKTLEEIITKTPKTPRQAELKSELDTLYQAAFKLSQFPLKTENTEREMETIKENIRHKKTKLRRLQNNLKSATKLRANRKQKLKELPEHIKKELNVHDTLGRPRPPDEDSMLDTIINLASAGAAADRRRNTEILRSTRGLENLTKALNSLGFNYCKSTVYRRLIPSRVNVKASKYHVKTVPVRLIKSANDLHTFHRDTSFAKSSIKDLESLASTLGPNQVVFHSQDNKAKVNIGVTAANKQAALIMNMNYRVKLPDHNFVVAAAHKLEPAVIADCRISPDKFKEDAVSYSGPTYIGIRSAKHNSSTAFNHLEDMKRIFKLEEFKSMKTEDNVHKPVLIVTVDGGPDENPRYTKTIVCAIDYFKHFDLDALFIATNAPGRSAFNRVERRMAPLSRDLAGLILEAEHFGTHLNSKRETIDVEKEKENFKFAGKTLADIWSQTVIDGHPVVAEYIETEASTTTQEVPIEWRIDHVREGQYMLQIVKCNKQWCCKKMRSNYIKIIPKRFLPTPISFCQKKFSVDVSKQSFLPLFQNLALSPQILTKPSLPYDHCCPSLQKKIKNRVCQKCKNYFATVKSLKCHNKHCNPSNRGRTRNSKPRRIISTRQEEVLVELSDNELEWIDREDMDELPVDAQIPHASREQLPGTPVLGFQDELFEVE